MPHRRVPTGLLPRLIPSVLLFAGGLAGLLACGGLRLTPEYSPEVARSPDERLRRFMDEVFQTRLDRDPELATRLGDRRGMGRWTDRSERALREDAQLVESDLKRLRQDFASTQLDSLSREEIQAFEYDSRLALTSYRWRDHEWHLGMFDGLQVFLPTLLVYEHPIMQEADLTSWLDRLDAVGEVASAAAAEVSERRQLGLLPPRFVLEAGIEQVRALLQGAPFEAEVTDCSLLTAFAERLERLEFSNSEQRQVRLEKARSILSESFEAGWLEVIEVLEEALPRAAEEHGVWRFPDGQAFYAFCLERATGSPVEAEDLHRDGMAEVRRLQEEIRTLKNRLGFAGSLGAFFDHLRADSTLYVLSAADSGQDALETLRTHLDEMRPRLEEILTEVPHTELDLQLLPISFAPPGSGSFCTSRSMGKARWWVDFSSPRCVPTYELEARAYGEGLPGRHLLESHLLTDPAWPVPPRGTATRSFVAGWSSYAEGLAKEMGAYQAPYSDLGRLTRQLTRVAHTVVDTGIHSRRWSLQQAVEYLLRNTAATEEEAERRCKQSITCPGEAAAAPFGRAQILELRASATRRLGSRFDLAAFHGALFEGAGLPWSVLAQRMASWSPALPR